MSVITEQLEARSRSYGELLVGGSTCSIAGCPQARPIFLRNGSRWKGGGHQKHLCGQCMLSRRACLRASQSRELIDVYHRAHGQWWWVVLRSEELATIWGAESW